jgi:hypothetical protein
MRFRPISVNVANSDYSAAVASAVAWLGNRYLLATPAHAGRDRWRLVSLTESGHRDPPATPSKLFLNERAEHCGPLAFEVSVQLETLLKQSFDSLQRLRPG